VGRGLWWGGCRGARTKVVARVGGLRRVWAGLWGGGEVPRMSGQASSPDRGGTEPGCWCHLPGVSAGHWVEHRPAEDGWPVASLQRNKDDANGRSREMLLRLTDAFERAGVAALERVTSGDLLDGTFYRTVEERALRIDRWHGDVRSALLHQLVCRLPAAPL